MSPFSEQTNLFINAANCAITLQIRTLSWYIVTDLYWHSNAQLSVYINKNVCEKKAGTDSLCVTESDKYHTCANLCAPTFVFKNRGTWHGFVKRNMNDVRKHPVFILRFYSTEHCCNNFKDHHKRETRMSTCCILWHFASSGPIVTVIALNCIHWTFANRNINRWWSIPPASTELS